MQSEVEDIINTLGQQPVFQCTNPCAGSRSCVVLIAQIVQVVTQLAGAERKGSWHTLVKDEERSDLSWSAPRTIFHAEPALGRDRPQDRFPLHIVDGCPDGTRRRQKDIIFHIKNACGVVGAFQKRAQSGKIVDVVAQHRAVRHTTHQGRVMTDQAQCAGQIAL